MTRYLLDTSIISNIVKPSPSRALLEWMAAQDDGDLHVSSLTIAEISWGILEKPAGRKRAELDAWFAGPEGPSALFAGRVLPFDEKAALSWAELMVEGGRTGKSRDAFDTIIAAIAVANGCAVVTDNVRRFPGVEVINPMRGGS